MAQGPYTAQRIERQSIEHHGAQMSMLVELDLGDRPQVQREEWLKFQTRVPLPLPADQPTIELAALIRLRDILDRQIAAMQSP
jgi:hypothetical protein